MSGPLISTLTPARTSDQPYRRGYANPAALRDTIAAAHRTSLPRTTAAALVDHVSVPVLALAAAAGFAVAPAWLAAVGAILAAVVIGRQLRALENLVHEASHFNWSRRHRTLNDGLATALAATPTGTRLAEYRAAHLRHHGRFGTAEDPDRQRYEDLDIEGMDRTRFGAFATGIARRFAAYQRGWLASLAATPLSTTAPLLWAVGVIGVPAWLSGGPGAAAVALVVFVTGYAAVLPVIRFVAESGEHRYRDADTVFDATISNLGPLQRLIFHPHGDGYHTVHHLWPGVPHHRVAGLHTALRRHDPTYASRLRYRTRTLSTPRRAGAPVPRPRGTDAPPHRPGATGPLR